MSGKNKASENGAVLIITLLLLAAIALISVDLSRNTLLDHAFSQATRSNLAAKPLMASYEALVARFLVMDFRESASKSGSMLTKNKRFKEWFEPYKSVLSNAEIEIEIEDENGRFPLKSIFPKTASEKIRAEFYIDILEKMIAHLLLAHGYKKGEDGARIAARRFINELLAWGGEKPVSNEAMKWYLSREFPYIPPHRPPESLQELCLVYWPEVEPDLAEKVLMGEDELEGLLGNCSLWSLGPINVNSMTRAIGWGLADNFQTATGFMEALEAERIKRGEQLSQGWENDIFAMKGIIRPPSYILSSSSRWYRARIKLRHGASQTTLESVGWLNKTQMNWICRAIL